MITILPIQKEDAQTIAELWKRIILETCAPAYGNNSEIIEEWISGKTPETILKMIKFDDLFIKACCDGVLAGIGAAKFDKELMACYVSPDFQGRGVGKEILTHIENAAANHNIKNYRVYSSLNASGFYEKMGYERAGDIVFHGKIASIPMEKYLKKTKS